ncbi:MAG: PhoH family protein, partial [Eubacteriaceae bacterium]|nr:PhoH family protein [Eubacteriaceae bacterium]
PLYDALYDIMGIDVYQKYMERGMIEVAPLAYMRGRTLDDSFIILDEAQNTTPEQMKMFLTRLGFGSKAIVTGDITQVDLPSDKTSGLIKVQHILQDIKGLEFVYLTQQDVVRHSLVQKIIDAYEKYENKKK